MITAFEVGSIFRIVDEATNPLRKIGVEVRKINKAVEELRLNLKALGRGAGLRPFATLLADVNKEMSKTIASTKAISSGFSTVNSRIATSVSNANRFTSAISPAVADTKALASQWQAVAMSARAAGTAAAAAGAGGGGRGLRPPGAVPIVPGGGRGGRGGGGAGRRAAGHGRHAHFSQSIPSAIGHSSIGFGGETGDVLSATGLGLFAMFETAKQSKEELHQEALLENLGLDPDEIKSVVDKAWSNTRSVGGTKIADNIAAIGEMYSIVGLQEALSMSPAMAQMDRVLAGSGKGKDEGSAFILTRANELMGQVTDPITGKVDMAKFERQMDIETRAVSATHGKVLPADWLAFAKQGGPSAANLTERGFYEMVSIIQAMGGNRAGTAASAITRQFAGGIMTQRTAGELERLGIAKPGDFEIGRGGQVKAKTDAMKDLVHKFLTEPLSAVLDEVIPALESKGIRSQEDISREIFRFMGTGPGQREMYELIRGKVQIGQESDRMQKANGYKAGFDVLANKDPDQVTTAFTSAFANMLAAIGGPLMTAAIPKMIALTNIFNSLQSFSLSNPGVISGGAKVLLDAVTGGAFSAAGKVIGLFGGGNSSSVATPAGSAGGVPFVGPDGGPSSLSYDATAPAAIGKQSSRGDVYLDGKKVGMIINRLNANALNGPNQGSAYFDTTSAMASVDYGLARG